MIKLDGEIKKIPVLDVVGCDMLLTKSGKRYYRGVEHDSLVVDTEKNLFFWNSIGISGNALDWMCKIRGYSIADALEYLQKFSNLPLKKSIDRLFEPNKPYYRLLKVFYELGKSYREYWYGRGYSDDSIDKFMLGYTGKYHVIPVIYNGELVNFQCRTPDKRIWSWVKNSKKQPFNFEVLTETDWVIITESPVDAIIADQYGFPAVSIFPNALSWDRDFTKHFLGINKVYLFYDNDKAGWRGMRRVSKYLNCSVVDWEGYPEKTDVGDILNDYSRDAMKDLIENSLPSDALSSDARIELYRELRERIKDEYN